MEVDGIPSDGVAGAITRMSMQARRSGDEGHRRSNSWSLRSPITGRHGGGGGDNQHLMHSYDIEAGSLGDLAEDSDEDTNSSGRKRTSFEDANGGGHRMNGIGESSRHGPSRSSEKVRMGGKSFDRERR